jgi:hypothetical protein
MVSGQTLIKIQLRESTPDFHIRLRLRAPHARTAAVVWPLAGRAQGGAGCPCPRLAAGRIPAPRSALPPSALRGCAGRQAVAGALWGASLRVSAGLPGFCVGWCRGVVLGGGFSGAGGFSWLCRGSAVGSVVAAAGRVGAGRWGLSLAGAGLWARFFRRRGRGRVLVARRRCRVRGGLGRLGRFPAGVWGVSVPVAVPPSVRLSPPPALPAVSVWARAA